MSGSGVIMMWAGKKSNIPAGWHECDGTLVSQAQYPQLYAIIGESFGASPPEGQFYLPDLRGQFIRGVDDGSGRDPDVDERTDMQDPSRLYSGVGSIQKYALQSHKHNYTGLTDVGSGGEVDNAKEYKFDTLATGAPTGAALSDDETRPTNAYLYFIIHL